MVQNTFFGAYFVQKFKFATEINSNMQNSMTVFFASVLDGKHPFWARLIQKMKIVSFSLNLIHSLTQIWRVQCWCSLFIFFNDTPFYGKLVSKNQNCVCWSWNLEPRLIWLCNVQWWCSFFCFRPFLQVLSKHSLAYWWSLINLPAGY